MIRYVVAVLLAVAVFGLAFAALDYAAPRNSERIVTSDVADLEASAVSLYQEEELAPRGSPGPRRSVTIDLPEDDLTTVPVEQVDIRRVDANTTAVAIDVRDRPPRVVVFDVPTELATGSSSLTLTGSGSRELLLTLTRDADGDRVVRIARR